MAKSLIKQIDAYCRKAAIADSTLGINIMGDPHLIRRVREGKTYLETEWRISAWLKEHPAAKRTKPGRPRKPVSHDR